MPADQVTAPACSGHGRQSASGCTCDKGYAGEICQYETECDTDADCGQVMEFLKAKQLYN